MTTLDIFLTILSVISMGTAILFGFLSAKRNSKHDVSAEAQKLTSMEMDIKYIKKSVDEIKDEKLDYRITVLEQKVNTLESRA